MLDVSQTWQCLPCPGFPMFWGYRRAANYGKSPFLMGKSTVNLVNTQKAIEHGPIEIVDLPKMVIFHMFVYQRVIQRNTICCVIRVLKATKIVVHGISPKTRILFRKNTRITEMCVSPSPQIWDNWCDPSANCLSICLGLSRINQQVDTKQEFN